MAGEKKILAGTLLLLCALLMPLVSAGQNAGARKDFVQRLTQGTLVKRVGSKLIPAYRITIDGRDATSFVYHAAMMNASICRGMLTEGFVAKFRALGFTKLVCTDDGDETFTFDPTVQSVSPEDARRDYVEMVRRSVIRQRGASTPPGYTLSAEGPDATSYVHHQSAVSLADCNQLLEERFTSALRKHGFARIICTDDRILTFIFDLSPQSSATAFALLEDQK